MPFLKCPHSTTRKRSIYQAKNVALVRSFQVLRPQLFKNTLLQNHVFAFVALHKVPII